LAGHHIPTPWSSPEFEPQGEDGGVQRVFSSARRRAQTQSRSVMASWAVALTMA